MKVTHVCLALLQLLALSEASSRCTCGSTATQPAASTAPANESPAAPATASPANESAAPANESAAPASNSTVPANSSAAPANNSAAPANSSANNSAAPASDSAVLPSAGPSTGPARLLLDMYDADDIDRQLQDNTSDGPSNETETAETAESTESEGETAEEEECPPCPPEIVTTFTATLSLGSVADLAELDFVNIKTQLVDDLTLGDSVEMIPVVKIRAQYTLDVELDDAQCKAAVAVAYGITEDDVECSDASPSTAPVSNTSNASNATRRLQAVKSVTMSFTESQTATVAATDFEDVTQFTTALTSAGITASVTVEDVGVSVELMVTVTSEEAIIQPSVADLQAAVSATTSVAFEVAVTDVGVSYTRMPCSASDICEDGTQLVADAETVACDGETCTLVDRDVCCASIGNSGGAQGHYVLGSLFSMLLWHSF